LTPHHVRALAVRRSRRVGFPSDFRPPCVPLARVNQVLFGVKRRGGVSGRLSARESPDRPRERLAEGRRRDARALDERTAPRRRQRCVARKPRKRQGQDGESPDGVTVEALSKPPTVDDSRWGKIAPGAGIEPATNRLTADRSTTELS